MGNIGHFLVLKVWIMVVGSVMFVYDSRFLLLVIMDGWEDLKRGSDLVEMLFWYMSYT